MTMQTEAALQQGIYTCLTGHPALTALLPAGAGSITAHDSPDLAMPFVLIADTAVQDAGTQSYAGSDSRIGIEIYSGTPGGLQARAIAAAVENALVAGITMTGHVVITARITESATRLMNDGETYRTRLQLRVLSETVEDTP